MYKTLLRLIELGFFAYCNFIQINLKCAKCDICFTKHNFDWTFTKKVILQNHHSSIFLACNHGCTNWRGEIPIHMFNCKLHFKPQSFMHLNAIYVLPIHALYLTDVPQKDFVQKWLQMITRCTFFTDLPLSNWWGPNSCAWVRTIRRS